MLVCKSNYWYGIGALSNLKCIQHITGKIKDAHLSLPDQIQARSSYFAGLDIPAEVSATRIHGNIVTSLHHHTCSLILITLAEFCSRYWQ